MLKAVDLSKSYHGQPALSGLNLEIEPGEIFCLLGANGAGKTTTIHLFLGFLQATSGQALVGGFDVEAEPLEARRRLAYIPEQVQLYSNLSGLENLAYLTALAGRGDLTESELRGFLRRAGLEDEAATRRVATYSKGMRQKVGLAITLAKGAEALLLDEPTSGLDPQAANELSRLLQQLADSGCSPAVVLCSSPPVWRSYTDSGSGLGCGWA